jgi:hypothetical protein
VAAGLVAASLAASPALVGGVRPGDDGSVGATLAGTPNRMAFVPPGDLGVTQFLPPADSRPSIIARPKADGTGTVSFVIQPGALHLAAGRHMIELASLPPTQQQEFMIT